MSIYRDPSVPNVMYVTDIEDLPSELPEGVNDVVFKTDPDWVPPEHYEKLSIDESKLR